MTLIQQLVTLLISGSAIEKHGIVSPALYPSLAGLLFVTSCQMLAGTGLPQSVPVISADKSLTECLPALLLCKASTAYSNALTIMLTM